MTVFHLPPVPLAPASLLAQLRESEEDELVFSSHPPPRWLVDRFFPAASLIFFVGRRGSFKSHILLDVLYRLSLGGSWWGEAIPEPIRVAYFPMEDASGLGVRSAAWRSAFNGGEPTGNLFWPRFRVDLARADHRDAVLNYIGERRIGAAAFDTIARSHSGEENDSQMFGQIMEWTDRVHQETGSSIFFSAHPPKGTNSKTPLEEYTPRGSGAQEGSAHVIFAVAPDREAGTTLFACIKQKNAPEPEPIEFALRPHGSSVVLRLAGAQTVDVNLPLCQDPVAIANLIVGLYGSKWPSQNVLRTTEGRATLRKSSSLWVGHKDPDRDLLLAVERKLRDNRTAGKPLLTGMSAVRADKP